MWHRLSTMALRRSPSMHGFFDLGLLRMTLSAVRQRAHGSAYIVAALKILDRRKNKFELGLRLHIILCLGHRVYNIRVHAAVIIGSVWSDAESFSYDSGFLFRCWSRTLARSRWIRVGGLLVPKIHEQSDFTFIYGNSCEIFYMWRRFSTMASRRGPSMYVFFDPLSWFWLNKNLWDDTKSPQRDDFEFIFICGGSRSLQWKWR